MSYKPDHRLIDAYREATELDEGGLRGLCPSYTELSEETVRFRDDALLGKGAVKDVYKTYNNHTRRWIAMARLRADRGPEFYDLFVHEAWLTASLSHPNIITVHDVGIEQDGRPFFTMDLKGQSTLADRCTESNAAGRGELLDVFIKVCDAVAYAHSRGVIHLDLKPENIQADEFGEVLVCDWGLAKIIGEMEEGEDDMPTALRLDSNMTLMGQIKGSPGYMAPEQIVPGSVKDKRSDIFALGCILHLILTGHPPFAGSNEAVMESTKGGKLVPPTQSYPASQIPEALEAVVLKATALDPVDRYDSVARLREDISNFLEGFSTLAEKPSFFREARLFLTRNRLPVSIVVAALFIIAVTSGFFVRNIERQQRKTAQERERALQFETRAETATTLYHDELDRSEEERIGMAKRLATSASDLKKLGIYVRPIETIREARKLIESALVLHDESDRAQLQRFSIDCITLDFTNALKVPMARSSELSDYTFFADAFPEFAFSEQHRPTIPQLTAFLQEAQILNPQRQAYIERVIAYDDATRGNGEGYTPVLEALLEYVNDGVLGSSVALQYNAQESSLLLHSEGRVRLTVLNDWGSQECLLRFMPFRTLKVIAKDRFYIGDLQNLQLETLDVSGCETLLLNQVLDLPLLRRLIIRPGQCDHAELRTFIKSNERFEIVE
ncbi:MAG: serine/threonine-protein kinase [Opitutaceae bacterium]